MASTPARVAGHPLHPMLVPLPIGLFVFSLICDVISRSGAQGPIWSDMAFFAMAGGVIGAFLAAVPGIIDFISLLGSGERRVRTIAATHMSINLAVVALYVANLYLRTRPAPLSGASFALSLLAIVVLLISGWLGGELVYVHGVAVAEEPTAELIERPSPLRRQVAH